MNQPSPKKPSFLSRFIIIALIILVILMIFAWFSQKAENMAKNVLHNYCQDLVQSNDRDALGFKYCQDYVQDLQAKQAQPLPSDDAMEQEMTADDSKTQTPTANQKDTPVSIPKSTVPAQPIVSGMIQAGKDPLLSYLDEQYTSKENYVHRDVKSSLIAMIEAAKKDRIHLEVISGFRSHGHQRSIWERKWNSFSGSNDEKLYKILRYSSYPGISRHHWGTDIDFNSLELAYWRSDEGMRTHQWLVNNAAKFGFCEPYSGKRNGGYENEPWHWSYKKIAYPLQQQRMQSFNSIFEAKILGRETAIAHANEIAQYVSKVSPSCTQ
ncbi:MAG: M15 family metallopeptidase [Acinetobacter sp.]|nr:M15 family metallopeptidase [Acinetobacter sp.]